MGSLNITSFKQLNKSPKSVFELCRRQRRTVNIHMTTMCYTMKQATMNIWKPAVKNDKTLTYLTTLWYAKKLTHSHQLPTQTWYYWCMHMH